MFYFIIIIFSGGGAVSPLSGTALCSSSMHQIPDLQHLLYISSVMKVTHGSVM